MRAPIFYDNNDTGYYFDGASVNSTRFEGVSDRTRAQLGNAASPHGSAQAYMRRPNFTSDQNYWVGSMGWGTQDMNTVFNWGSGFTDSWSNPGNQPSGTSHWVGTQALHYTNGSTRYGWQMVGGPIGNLRFRQQWGGSPGAWRTVPMLDVNDGNGGAMYAGTYYDSNNTGYYVDPASTSNFNVINVQGGTNNFNGITYFRTNNGGRLGRTDSAKLQAYSDSNNAAFMSFHKGGHYAVNFGLDDDNYMRIGGWSAAENRWELDMSGNNWVASSFRAPIFYDSNNTGYFCDPNSNSRFSSSRTDTTYFGSDTNKGYATGYGTWSMRIAKMAYMSFDWNANYDTYSNHGIASTDINGSFSDSMSINSFNDINLRLDANNNNTNSYVRIHDNSTGNGQNVAYIGRENGNAIAYFYNRVYGNIYYDHNSGYYGEFNGTSRMNRINADYVIFL
jgi:hypothetical protein